LTKVKLAIEQAMKAQRRSRVMVLLFLNLGVGWSMPRPGCFAPGKRPSTQLWLLENTSILEHINTFCIYLWSAQGKYIPGLTGKSLSVGFSALSFSQ